MEDNYTGIIDEKEDIQFDVLSSIEMHAEVQLEKVEKTEVSFYLDLVSSENLNHEKFWMMYKERLPTLYQEYKKLKSISIANASVERLFSHCKILCNWKRNKLKFNKIEKIMLAKDFLSRNNFE